jgi:hypothetical protein
VIRVTQQSEFVGYDDLVDWFTNLDDIAYDEFTDVVNEVEPIMLDELRLQVGKPKYPIRWKTKRQKAAFFATDGFGGGIPTKRTGKVQASWQVKVERDLGAFSVIVENITDYAKFVYGSLAKSGNAAKRFQQPFHKDTGYPLATETVQYWLDVIDDKYRERMIRIIDTVSTRRAFTKGTPRK